MLVFQRQKAHLCKTYFSIWEKKIAPDFLNSDINSNKHNFRCMRLHFILRKKEIIYDVCGFKHKNHDNIYIFNLEQSPPSNSAIKTIQQLFFGFFLT